MARCQCGTPIGEAFFGGWRVSVGVTLMIWRCATCHQVRHEDIEVLH